MGSRDHVGNSLSGRIDVGRGTGGDGRRVLAQFSGHRSMVPSGPIPAKLSISLANGERVSADGVEHEDRDLPVGLRLVLGVVGPCLDRALPPGGLFVVEDLAGLVVAGGLAVLQLDRGFFLTL
jgi:hypothetical protein